MAHHHYLPRGLMRRAVSARHWLHARPELGYDLDRTARYVSLRLKSLGIAHETGIAQTGIVATIPGKGTSDRCIGFRADMDALPIAEKSDAAYRSVHCGRMHACGHDGHTAILLGLAEYLSTRQDFDGTVRLVFQPAEEGFAGARRMVEEGLFERFPMERIFALHNWPDLPPGVIGTQRGPIMASSYLLRITLNGRGGHGAMPHNSNPLMSVAAHIQLALNTYLAQQVNAQRAIVVSLTQVKSNDSLTALPDQAQLLGSVRILHKDAADRFLREITQLVRATAAGFGVDAVAECSDGYPVTQNDPASARIVEDAVAALGLPHESEATGLDPSMASEDFAYMLDACPGAYFWLGQGGGPEGRALHAPSYDFNDDVLETGISLMAEIARHALNAPPPETT
jgi:hippurate hydrolase